MMEATPGLNEPEWVEDEMTKARWTDAERAKLEKAMEYTQAEARAFFEALLIINGDLASGRLVRREDVLATELEHDALHASHAALVAALSAVDSFWREAQVPLSPHALITDGDLTIQEAIGAALDAARKVEGKR